MKIGELIRSLNSLGCLELVGKNLDIKEMTEHNVNQKHWMETSILPYLAISSNLTFLSKDSDRVLVFGDGSKADVISVEEKAIFELESEIQNIYHIDAYSFAKKWFSYLNGINSFYFLVIKSKKI